MTQRIAHAHVHVFAIACVVVGAVVTSTSALAYRPPARVLLQKAMERQFDRTPTKTLRVDLETQLYELTGASKGPSTSERWTFEAPGNVKKETDAGAEVRVEDRITAPKPGKAGVDFLFDQLTAAPPLDPDRAAERLFRDMRTIGVNTDVVAFARFDGRVAYLIGSKPWETDKPQVWLDKDSLLLLRVVLVNKGDDGKLHRTDIRYLGWGSPLGGNWFPSNIEVWTDDHIVKRSSLRNVERGIAVEPGTFPH